ncbi:MAG: glycosyltransferase [Elusimicrobia bacterium]|nr:glycosyltransferase [Elusimicrobiota bacterium]MBD3411523.1 glycosyltransferase [Elusimicrobiota bacterium]
MAQSKPVIAHINKHLFQKSETFIYNYIVNLKHYEPICCTARKVHPELFPFPSENLYVFPQPHSLLRFLGMYSRIDYIGKGLQLREILRTRNARLLHAHYAYSGYLLLPLKKELDIPLITMVYGYDVSLLPQENQWKINYAMLFRDGNIMLAEGLHMKSVLMKLGCPEEKIRIQRIAIPVTKIPYRERAPKKTGYKIIFLFCGRFVEKKGIMFALQALTKAKQAGVNFEFRLIGDGPLHPAIRKYSAEHDLDANISLLGMLNYQQYLQQLDQADLFLHPSTTADNGDSEGGAPTTILEAQAAGVPVIATTHADIPNITLPDRSALLSPERDIEQLFTNIMRICSDQKQWAAMGKAGRSFVEQYHDIAKEIYNLESIYASVI